MISGRLRLSRLILGAIGLAFAVTAGPARASDGATLNPIGFSGDGRYFAFEQFGVKDPAGYPYWSVSVLDTEKNIQAEGSPAAVMLEDSSRSILDARAKLRSKSAALLKATRITEPYALLAANPNTQLVADRRRLSFERWYNSGGADPKTLAFANLRYELEVGDVTVPKPGTCDGSGGPYVGVELKIRNFEKDQWRTIYADDGLPRDRGCAVAYEVAAVIARASVNAADRLVAIIGVYSDGFQGLDHRFFAVPFQLPK